MTNKFTQYKKNIKLNSKKHENHFCVFCDKFSIFFITVLFLYSLFSILNFNPLTREFVNHLIINKAYAIELTQVQLDQTASILSSIQSIINKLKIEIQELFGKEAKATTETIGLVRQDCSGYSNCYTSLSAWEAAYGGVNFGACAQGDLVCADKIAVAQIDGAWTQPDTYIVDIDGWITDVTHYVKIYTTMAARHKGLKNSGYRIAPTSASSITIISRESYTIIDGIEVHALINATGIWTYYTTGSTVKNNLVYSNGGSGAAYRLTSAKAYNNIAVGPSQYAFWFDSGSGSISYNNTSYGNFTYGHFASGAYSPVIKNSIDFSCTYCFWHSGPNNWDSTSDYNISSDNRAPGINSLKNQTLSQIVFQNTTSGSEDLHIQSTSVAKDVGADLSADFTIDIDGDTRSGTWDIGAGEYTGAAPPPPSDTTLPVLSSGSPAGTLPVGTTQTTLSVEAADVSSPVSCKYSQTPGTAYASMTGTLSTANGTTFTATVTGLTNGTSYNYYIRCQDATGNANTIDYTISFSVSAPAGDTTPPTVSITSPTNGATVSGTITITANATDNAVIAGVQFKLDTTTNLGTEDTTSPYSYSLNTTTIADGSHCQVPRFSRTYSLTLFKFYRRHF